MSSFHWYLVLAEACKNSIGKLEENDNRINGTWGKGDVGEEVVGEVCQGMYEITEHEKQYINQDDALVTVSFQLPRHDWNLLGTSTEWRQFEILLREMKTSRERGRCEDG